MKRIARKYVLIILAFLTTLLCSVGASTWIILSQKTATPSKRALITPTLTDVKITTPIFYSDTIANSSIEVTGKAKAKLSDGSEREVKGTFEVTSRNLTAFSSTSKTAVSSGTGYTITNENNKATIKFTPTNQDLYNTTTTTITGTSIPVYAVATYNDTYYNKLSEALAAAENKTSGTVNVLPSSYEYEQSRAVSAKTITTKNTNNTVTIPSGVTLSLSYRETTTFELLNTSSNYDSHDVPAFSNRTHSYYASASDSSNQKATTLNPYETYLKNKVTLGSNVILHNFGTLIVGGIIGGGNGGKAYSSHTAADFAQLTLASSSKIVNYTTGSKEYAGLQCYGLINETTEGASQGIENNGSILTPFTLREHRGGSAFFAVSGVSVTDLGWAVLSGQPISATPEIMPFNRFYFPNITPALSMDYNANANSGVVYGYVDLYASNKHNETQIGLVGNTNQFIIQLQTNASIKIDYNNSTEINTLDIYGNMAMNSLGFSLAAVYESVEITVNISASKAHFPISWYYDVNLHKAKNGSNATVTLNQKLKIMPGGSLSIDKGVSVIVPELAVYSNGYELNNTTDTTGATYVAPKYGTTYPSTSSKSGTSFANGEIILNGELSSTTFGGTITSTQSGAKFVYTNAGTTVKELSYTTGSITDAKATSYDVVNSLSLPTVSGTTNNAGTYYSKKTATSLYWGTPATVTINYSGTTITDKTYTDYLIGETYTLTSSDLPTPTKEHYTFNEWYFDSALTDKADAGDIKNLSSTTTAITLYPKFTPITYNIVYQYTGLDGVTYPDLPDGLSTTFSIESGNIALPIDITWDGTNYTFSGWYFDANCTNDVPNSIPFATLYNYTQNGTLTLYGEWTDSAKTVILTAGETSPYTIEDIVVTTSTLNYVVGAEYQNMFSVHNNKTTAEYQYYFDGWYYDSTCTVAYDSKQGLLNPDGNGIYTLYAKWSEKKVLTIDYDTATNPKATPIGATTVYLRPNGHAYTLPTFTSDTDTDVPKYSNGWSIIDGEPTIENGIITITEDSSIKVVWDDKYALILTGNSRANKNAININETIYFLATQLPYNGLTSSFKTKENAILNAYDTDIEVDKYFDNWVIGTIIITDTSITIDDFNDKKLTATANWASKVKLTLKIQNGSVTDRLSNYTMVLIHPNKTTTTWEGDPSTSNSGLTTKEAWLQPSTTYNLSVTPKQENNNVVTIDGTKANTLETATKNGTIEEAITINVSVDGDTGCIVEGTLITLADGTQKKVEDLTYTDQVLVFNHYTGKMEAGYIAMLDHVNDKPELTTITNLKFSNGSLLRIAWNHGVFDVTLNEYVFINQYNCQNYVGHKFYSTSYVNGEFVSEIVTLESAFVTEEIVRVFNPTTLTHMNYFAEGILNVTAAPEVVSGHVNYFELDENMKYDEEKMQADIEKYGVYTYEDFKDLLTEEQFNALPFKYLKVSVRKGLITWDGIVAIIEYLLSNSLM